MTEFSRRLDWDLRPNRLSQLLDETKAGGARVLDLTESNPTAAGLPAGRGGELEALSNEAALIYRPEAKGLRVAREAVAGYYRSRRGTVDPDRILLTASTSEAYAWLFKLLADPGDEVLVPQPSYPLFEFLARMELAEVRGYPLAFHEGWWVDIDAVRGAVTDRTRALVVVNPNNPAGSYLKVWELDVLLDLCQERGIALISDEVFFDFALCRDPTRASAIDGDGRALTFVLSGLSKVAGLPQMKLSWMVVEGPESLRAAALERLELIADTFLSVSAPVQHAAGRWLASRADFQRRVIDRARRNLDRLRAAVPPASGSQVLEVEGGWYAVVRQPSAVDEEQWVLDLLEHDHVLVQPGYFYDFPFGSHVVISLLTEPHIFDEAAERLERRFSEMPCQ